MTTYTKANLVKMLTEDLDLQVSSSDAKNAIETLIALIKNALIAKKDVALLNYGRLSPRYKAGGRPVRNPKTNEEFTMPSVGTVTLGGKKGDAIGRVNTSELFEELSAELENKALAAKALETFLQVIIATKSGECRLEIRDFGVFHANWNEPRKGRNPKTEENVDVEGKYRAHFKIGANFKKQMTEAYA